MSQKCRFCCRSRCGAVGKQKRATIEFIPDKQTLIDEIAAWEHDRNTNHTKANWHTTAKALGLTIPESFLLRADEVIE